MVSAGEGNSYSVNLYFDNFSQTIVPVSPDSPVLQGSTVISVDPLGRRYPGQERTGGPGAGTAAAAKRPGYAVRRGARCPHYLCPSLCSREQKNQVCAACKAQTSRKQSADAFVASGIKQIARSIELADSTSQRIEILRASEGVENLLG